MHLMEVNPSTPFFHHVAVVVQISFSWTQWGVATVGRGMCMEVSTFHVSVPRLVHSPWASPVDLGSENKFRLKIENISNTFCPLEVKKTGQQPLPSGD